MSIDISKIIDPAFHARFVELPDIICSWVEEYLDLRNSAVLDFGCGEGLTALGMVMSKRVAQLTAVDIMPDVHACLPRAREHLNIDSLPENLSLRQISPGEEFAEDGVYDFVYSWSVFEHVEQHLLPVVLKQIRRKLKRDGLFFIQIAPLYFSADGSHLFHRIPEPWGHLINQDSIYFRKLCEACSSKEEIDSLWSCYQWLNKITADTLESLLLASAFRVERKYFTESAQSPPPELLEIYNQRVLKTNQLVFLCRAV